MNGLADEQALMRRLGWRLMPVLVVMFLVAFIDRQNIGFAKLQMLSDLHISEAVFGFAASLFFIGYVGVSWRCSAMARDSGWDC
jgi:sugar phosphate permease